VNEQEGKTTMIIATHRLSRRSVLAAGAAGTALLAAPAVVRAQAQPIRLGSLTPLTGAGGAYGPRMRDAIAAVVNEVNAAGGVRGRPLQLVTEDDQTSPEAAVRAARKLIDVDRVAAVMGTWASSVTTAVAPLCWENRVSLFTVSGADSITLLPHQGYIFRTQPNSRLQMRTVAKFAVDEGAQRIAWMGPQTPFAQSSIEEFQQVAQAANRPFTSLIYEADKATYRSEVDQILRARPDFIMFGGYTPDSIVLARDLFRAGYQGKVMAPAYAISARMLEALPHEVTQGAMVYEPWPEVDSTAYSRLQRLLGSGVEVDPYTAQTYDHANLAVMALAIGGDGNGLAIKDNVRRISQGGGQSVDNAVDGLKAIVAGQKVDYSGASGPCDFTAEGDITGTKFRYQRVDKGAFQVMKIA
jgi:branched-chain amino acid transport system substrate-binding protein